jgi:hypothetical protein
MTNNTFKLLSFRMTKKMTYQDRIFRRVLRQHPLGNHIQDFILNVVEPFVSLPPITQLSNNNLKSKGFSFPSTVASFMAYLEMGTKLKQ